ncbi:hypothetical protein B296_00037930, partial [Ensete ventricosum]
SFWAVGSSATGRVAATPAGPAAVTPADPPALSRFRPPPRRLPRRSSARPAPFPSPKLLSLPSLTAQRVVVHLSSLPPPLFLCRCTYPPFTFSFVEAVAVEMFASAAIRNSSPVLYQKLLLILFVWLLVFSPSFFEKTRGKVEELKWLHFCSVLTKNMTSLTRFAILTVPTHFTQIMFNLRTIQTP